MSIAQLMPFNNHTLDDLAAHVREFAVDTVQRRGLAESLQVCAIILYGSAAKHHIGSVEQYGDFDLNVFLQRKPGYQTGDARKLNRRGHYWSAGKFAGKDVEVLFNVLDDSQDWPASVAARTSARWCRIKMNPIVQLLPDITIYRNGIA